jgi:hypothetical protein
LLVADPKASLNESVCEEGVNVEAGAGLESVAGLVWFPGARKIESNTSDDGLAEEEGAAGNAELEAGAAAALEAWEEGPAAGAGGK